MRHKKRDQNRVEFVFFIVRDRFSKGIHACSISWKTALRIMTVMGPLVEIKQHFIGNVISHGIFSWLLRIHTSWMPNSSSVCYSWLDWLLMFLSDVPQLLGASFVRPGVLLCSVSSSLRYDPVQAVPQEDKWLCRTFCPSERKFS